MSLLEYWNVDADDNSDALTAGLIDAIGDGVNALLDPKSTDRDATSNRERVASAIKATDSRIWELAEALRRTRQDRDDFENAVGAEQQRVADLEQDVATVTARAGYVTPRAKHSRGVDRRVSIHLFPYDRTPKPTSRNLLCSRIAGRCSSPSRPLRSPPRADRRRHRSPQPSRTHRPRRRRSSIRTTARISPRSISRRRTDRARIAARRGIRRRRDRLRQTRPERGGHRSSRRRKKRRKHRKQTRAAGNAAGDRDTTPDRLADRRLAPLSNPNRQNRPKTR
jgi:hypothetical protein